MKHIDLEKNDFITSWVEQISLKTDPSNLSTDDYAKESLIASYENCLTFP